MIKLKKAIIAIGLLLCAQSAQGQEYFSRNIEQTTFVPKGQWIVGLSANYSQSKYDNFQYLVIEDISGDNYSVKVSPMLCFAFKDDLAAGARFSYNRSRTKVNGANVVLSSEDNFDVDNLYMISQSYNSTAMLRNYMSIGKSKRFGIVNEMDLRYGFSQSKLTSGTGNDFTGTFARTHTVGVGLAPGLLMFLNNYSALEVNVGVLELSYSKTKQTTDQIYISNTKSKAANLRVNLFSIAIGVSFYL